MSAIKTGKMTEEQVDQFLANLRKTLLEAEGVEFRMYRSVKDTTKPGDVYNTYQPGKGLKVIIEVPCEKDDFYMDMPK